MYGHHAQHASMHIMHSMPQGATVHPQSTQSPAQLISQCPVVSALTRALLHIVLWRGRGRQLVATAHKDAPDALQWAAQGVEAGADGRRGDRLRLYKGPQKDGAREGRGEEHPITTTPTLVVHKAWLVWAVVASSPPNSCTRMHKRACVPPKPTHEACVSGTVSARSVQTPVALHMASNHAA